MPAKKRIGYKTQLGVSVTGSTTGFADVACIIGGINGPEADRTEVDTTCLADDYKSSQPTATDPGSVTFDVVYDPEDTVSRTLTDLLTQRAPIPRWQITFPISASTTETQPTEEFDGWVKSLGREMQQDGMVKRSVTIRVSGNPGFTAST